MTGLLDELDAIKAELDAIKAELDALRAKNARLREALCWYARGDFDYVRRCSSWDGGATARAALEVKP
jgi:predicted nuclease with TOPRIM domain